ncbi:ABC transporter substrate-binding protein [bacterium]|nr:MAG: ABC transporter substrate-binding protein [bacterium]
MHMLRSIGARAVAAGTVLAMAAAIGAPASAASSTAAKVALPAAIAKAGVVRVGSHINYPPAEFYAAGSHKVVGFEYDLMAAVGKHLGTKMTWTDTPFAGIVPALYAGRFDIIVTAMSDTPEREKRVTYVDYFLAGSSILVKKGNPEGIHSIDDLCGKAVDVELATSEDRQLKAASQDCLAKGKQAISLLEFDSDSGAFEQLKIGRSVAHVTDFPVAAYLASSEAAGNAYEVAGSQFDVSPYGIGIRTDQPELAKAIQAGLQAVIDSGEYAKILKKWNVSQGAVTKADINGGAHSK